MTSNTVEKIDVPAWDVALEALVREEQDKSGKPLRIADFQRLAKQHAIRFDDIMTTMFELVLQGIWQYAPCSACAQRITRDVVNSLFVNRRLKEADVLAFDGTWSIVIH